MTWRLTQETRVPVPVYDVARNIWQALSAGHREEVERAAAAFQRELDHLTDMTAVRQEKLMGFRGVFEAEQALYLAGEEGENTCAEVGAEIRNCDDRRQGRDRQHFAQLNLTVCS